jgi:hypothetical protein
LKIKRLVWLMLFCSSFLLSGCLYPKERLAENQLTPMEQVKQVQKGIDDFFAENSILPILTKEANTPIYEKYVIEFRQMVPKYIPYVPGSAFEKGGSYLFVLTDVEKKPTVKLLDLKVVDKISDIQSRVTYFYEKRRALPVAGVIKSGYFTINFKDIGLSTDQSVESPLTGAALPVIMSSTGEVGVDYTKDLESVLKNNNIRIPTNTDVREILPQNSIYVPVKSFPYRMENDKPTLVFEH